MRVRGSLLQIPSDMEGVVSGGMVRTEMSDGAQMWAYIHVCMYVCMHACMNVCIYVFLYYVCIGKRARSIEVIGRYIKTYTFYI